MAEQEEDFSSLPLPDRFTHKVRKEGLKVRIPLLLKDGRIGKCERKATKMPRKHSPKPQMNQIRPLGLSYKTRGFGVGLCLTRM